MCGLFGLARPEEATCRQVTTQALLMLGQLAEERGVDSAGLAFWPAAQPVDRPADRLAERPDVTVDGWRVVKQLGRFGELRLRNARPALDAARVVLGHTRQATQGDVHRLVNVSPLATGGLLGTHNGDVTARALRERYSLGEPTGETDSELIFAALEDAADEVAMLDVLSGLEGRAALAWVDRRRPGRLWLARAALSPLAVGVTTGGDLLWASNPDWLRRVSARCGLALRHGVPALVPEGTLLAFDIGDHVRYAGSADFTPRPRLSDLRLAWAIWRGFGAADRQADQAGLRSVAALGEAGQQERPAA
jgi:glucosamine 6-phosphate synthetase-like amidotransferase/phosphosugar isomerase protein